MTRYVVHLRTAADRAKAHQIVDAAPIGTRIEAKAAKRSLPQNSRLWASLTDVAQQVPWGGRILRPDDWRDIFMDALPREIRAVPNLDEDGLVMLGRSSSDLSKEEMSNLLELIYAFGARRGVVFQDDARAA
jgi:hypothetical protein